MLFLGAASNYKAKDILRHTFSFGTSQDFDDLKMHLALRYGVNFDCVTLFHNGRSALCAGLKAALPKNSKVLINGFTCHAVLEAVKTAGCVPVFADIETNTLHFDVKILRQIYAKHPDLKAVIIQNSLGIPVDIAKISQFAELHNLVIIEDLAHCTGVHYPDNRETGTIGDIVALSFGKGKSIDTISGGALVIRNRSIKLPKQPMTRPRLSDSLRDRWYPFFGACMRGARHIHLHKLITGLFLKLHFIERSADAKLNIRIRLTYWQAKLALQQFAALSPKGRKPIREHLLVENRDKLLEELSKHGYHFDEFWYEKPVSPARYYQKVHFPEQECPNSVIVSQKIINIPTYYTEEELAPALKIIREHQGD